MVKMYHSRPRTAMECMYIKVNQQHIQINMTHDDILFIIVAGFHAAKLVIPLLILGYFTLKLTQ